MNLTRDYSTTIITNMSGERLSFIVGVGMEVAAAAMPQAYPDAPAFVWYILTWGGGAIIMIAGAIWVWEWRRSRIDFIDPAEEMAGYEALNALSEARPNSYETTAINLADAARLGKIKAWGRPRPKMAIPNFQTAVEQISPDVWAYAVLDASYVHGPLPRSDMMYRQKWVKPYIEDDRTLFDAVRFNKKEVMALCRAEKVLRDTKLAVRKMCLLGVLVGLLALGAAWPALADEKFDPKQVRVITPTGATSKCIGDPKTPICAVETFIACGWQLDMRLCKRVGVYNFSFSEHPETVRYRILSMRVLSERDIPLKYRSISLSMAGDTEVTAFIYSEKIPSCGKECETTYVLRKVGAAWQVVTWTSWGDD